MPTDLSSSDPPPANPSRPEQARPDGESADGTGDALLRHVAVYGTLMRGFGAQRRLGIADQLQRVGTCRFAGRLYDLGAYPGAAPPGAGERAEGSAAAADEAPATDEDGVVQGELYRIRDPRALAAMDRLEGYDPDRPEASHYVRRATELLEPTGRTAWVYWYNGPTAPHDRIPSGSWAAHVGTTEEGE